MICYLNFSTFSNQLILLFKSYYSYSLTFGQLQAVTGSITSHEFHVPHSRRLITRSSMIPASVIAIQTTASVLKTNRTRSDILIPDISNQHIIMAYSLTLLIPWEDKAVNVPASGYSFVKEPKRLNLPLHPSPLQETYKCTENINIFLTFFIIRI